VVSNQAVGAAKQEPCYRTGGHHQLLP
jgi:hypothetical protein